MLRIFCAAAAALLVPAAAFADDTILFVGGSHGEGTTATLTRLKDRLATADPKTTTVVFTGNYGATDAAVAAHVTATRAFAEAGGNVYFLPGHEDFAEGGAKQVKALRKRLNRAYGLDGRDAMPLGPCGDLIELELSKITTLLLLNSQWWMQDWANDSDANDGCGLKTRENFSLQVHSALSSARKLRLVIASHHPLESYGELGGAFTAKAHLDPLPILGTARVLALQAGLVPQYRNHPVVHAYTDLLRDDAMRYGGAIVFASGHDASLQHVAFATHAQIVAGTSGPTRPVTSPRAGDFAAATPGWAELTIDAHGEGTTRLISGPDGTTLFDTALPALPKLADDLGPVPPMPQGPVRKGYSKLPVWKLGSVTQFFVGSFYSDAFALELPYEVLDLQKAGLTPYKTGGGLQTNSLRLRDQNGDDWAIRATTKDSSRALPYPFNQVKAVNRLIDHGLTATHPEGALAVPALAKAMGVLHTEPRLMYLPDQAAMGPLRGYVANEVVLLERRPKDPKDPRKTAVPRSLNGPPSAHGPTKLKDTNEVFEKLEDDPVKHHVDQEAMLRARLLDLLIGDWDRHHGQWAFAVKPEADGSKSYHPIPRDRDQAFANYDGLLFALAKIGAPMGRNLQPFRADYGSVGWLIHSGRSVDFQLLNRVPHDRWMEIARAAQAAVTDAVIDEAFARWHPEAYALDGARLAEYTKARRDTWLEVAEEFYQRINADLDVLGSSEADVFEATYLPNGNVRLVGRTKDGVFFDRALVPNEHREIRVYALEGDDRLIVRGVPHGDLPIRFVGGEGFDRVTADHPAKEAVWARGIRLYDDLDGAVIDPSIDVRDERSDEAPLNQYDRAEGHEPDHVSFIPGFLINPDDGLYLGGDVTWVVQGYKKRPFAARHRFDARVATATLGVLGEYHGLFPQTAGLLDQRVDLIVKSPTYTRNFYGLTNRYVDEAVSSDYYRVRQAVIDARYGLAYGFNGDRTTVGAQAIGLIVATEATPGRFISSTPDVSADTFGPRYFAGARLFAQTNTFDNPAFPRRGVALHGSVEGRYDVRSGSQYSTTYRGAGGFALPFDRSQRFVLLSRASIEGIVGAHPFYFSPSLGADELRAYPRQRFHGDVAFAHSTDVRVDVFRFLTGIPSTLGFNLGVDHGRVFGVADSDLHHVSLGGGLWWFVLDTFGIGVNAHASPDGAYRVSVAVGPLFGQADYSIR